MSNKNTENKTDYLFVRTQFFEMASEPSLSAAAEPDTIALPTFRSSSGNNIVYERLLGKQPGIVYLHGIHSSMNGEKSNALRDHCVKEGRAFVRFDYSGHGQSEGSFEECNVSTWLSDVQSIMDNFTEGKQVIVGSSLGGWLMILYAMRNPDKLHALVGIAVAADYTQRIWNSLNSETKKQVKTLGYYEYPSPYNDKPHKYTLQFFQDGAKHTVLDMPGLEIIKAPIRLLHGAQDEVIPTSVSLALMQKITSTVTLEVIDDGDHRLSRPDDLLQLVQIIDQCCSNDVDVTQEVEDD